MTPVAAVILAAGASTRLGRPKQTVVLGGETLLERAVRIAKAAGLSPVIAVVADADLIDSLKALGATVLLNRKSHEGIASSIRAGVQWAKGIPASGVVLMTCDQVAVQPEHLQALCEEPLAPAGSSYAGQIGVPAYFPALSFADLLSLEGDTGARRLLRGARSIHTEHLALDIDTEADLVRAHALIEGRAA